MRHGKVGTITEKMKMRWVCYNIMRGNSLSYLDQHSPACCSKLVGQDLDYD